MDPRNRFHSPTTFRIIRAEHLLVLVTCSTLAVLHWQQIHWGRALFAFFIIDIVGYLPGAIAFRKQKGRRISHWYHHSYNIAHTYLVTGAAVALWAYCIGGLEWAMLAVPIHLSIDRGIFGNTLKPTELLFEPAEHSDSEVLAAMGRIRQSPYAVLDLAPNDPRWRALRETSTCGASDHPSEFLAQSNRNHHFLLQGIPGYIAYRKQGKHLWVFGGVHANPENAAILLDEFVAFAQHQGLQVAAVQVRPNQVPLFTSRGFDVNQFGSTYAVSLATFTTSGGKKMQLRNKINQARKAGFTVVELGREVPRDESWFAKLHAISEQWVKSKGSQELDFMVGELGTPQDTDRRIFIVLNSAEEPVAFITYVPVYGTTRPGYLHDLTRRQNETAPGVMELCNVTAIERFKSEGVGYLHFGFTPLVIDEAPESFAHRWLHRLLVLLRKHGQRLYSADSQVAYKLKWGTDIIEREYLAVRPLSLRSAYDFLQLTRAC